MKRRQFLRWSVGASLLGGAGLVAGRAWVPNFDSIDIRATGLNGEQWRLVAAVQAHLFPSEEKVPGAPEVRATAWLQWVLSDPDLPAESRTFFANGATGVERLAGQRFGRSFPDLGEAEREAVLREFEGQGGQSWLREILHYILEATLTDPVYGGNPDGVGWRWLEHRPGFRRPSKETRYFLLT